MLLRNRDGLLPLSGTGRVAVVGPLADTLFEDWYSGTMPYRITAAAGLAVAAAGRGGTVETVEGVDPIALRAASTGAPLIAAGPRGRLTAARSDGGRGDTAGAEPVGGEAQFDLFDWDLGVLTLRNAGTGRYAGLNEDASVTADRRLPGGWDVHETFRLEAAPGGGELLRSVLTGRYAVLDAATGDVAMSSEDPADAERFTLMVLRGGVAAAVGAAERAGTVVVVCSATTRTSTAARPRTAPAWPCRPRRSGRCARSPPCGRRPCWW
ncbi:beta-glucosidase [Actinacidiphila rubida]|uniref:Beta-glucosidase n=1 Tax=Actinacidiphila rubida TaxID=310780 RepID=A0A1H8UUU4_9ACTN|nr:glycoside hydrolase family 3 C-terminal domain-containing protein [Actinacidiphila rubida]SEP06931.1 beta-glucosidase [Actinacidiphila rubida]